MNGQKILVLRRQGRKLDNILHVVDLKLRKNGKDGMFLEDESLFLEDEPEILAKLLDGKIISL